MKLKKIKKYDAGGAVVDRNYFGSQPFAAGKPKKQRLFADGGKIGVQNITTLEPQQEIAYKNWMNKSGFTKNNGWNVDDNLNGNDYDYRGYWKKYGVSGLSNSGVNGVHFTDEFKLPNHETFSDESVYSSKFDKRGSGYWDNNGNYVKYDNGGNIQPMSNISLSKPYLPNTPIQIGNSMNIIAEQRANKLKKIGVLSPQEAFAYRLPQGNPLFANGGYVGRFKFDDGGNIEAADAIQGGLSGAATGAAVGSVIPGIGTAIGAGVGFLAGGIGGYFKGKNDYNAEQEKIKENQRAQQSMTNVPVSAYGTTFANGGKIYIKPSHKGLETAEAKAHGQSPQGFASTVLAHKENYSPSVIKRAVFAHNSAGWKHEDGGLVNPHLMYAMGGHIDSKGEEAREPHQTINVEKNELETKNGRMVNDFMNKPKHPINGSMNPNGNTIAQKGNTIIPAYMRTSYLGADLIKRKQIESKLKSDQTKRQQFANRKFAEGGYIGKFDSGGTVDQSLLYTDPQEYLFQTSGNTPTSLYPPKTNTGLGLQFNPPISNTRRLEEFNPSNSSSDNDNQSNNNPFVFDIDRSAVNYNKLNSSPINYDNFDPQKSPYPYNTDSKDNNQSANNFDYKKLIPYASNITNAILTAHTPKYANPVLNNHIALNNRLEIQPQLDDISNNARGTLNSIASRTNSGSIYRATAGDIYAKEQNERNKVYANAANYKNGIINQQILENNNIDRGNNDTTNKYNVMNTLRKMDINKSISQNVDNASSKMQSQEKDKALMDNDMKKALMVYGVFNQNGVLDRSGLEQSWPKLTEAHKKALRDAYPNETKNLQ